MYDHKITVIVGSTAVRSAVLPFTGRGDNNSVYCRLQSGGNSSGAQASSSAGSLFGRLQTATQRAAKMRLAAWLKVCAVYSQGSAASQCTCGIVPQASCKLTAAKARAEGR